LQGFPATKRAKSVKSSAHAAEVGLKVTSGSNAQEVVDLFMAYPSNVGLDSFTFPINKRIRRFPF
jgi:hypothetical protein